MTLWLNPQPFNVVGKKTRRAKPKHQQSVCDSMDPSTVYNGTIPQKKFISYGIYVRSISPHLLKHRAESEVVSPRVQVRDC
jgi:hypothetical protein